MKVALVCPYDWLRHGGVQAHVRQLAARLAVDHEVRVLTTASGRVPRPDAQYQVVGVGTPVPVPFNDSVAPVALSPLAAGRVRRELSRFAPHVTHVHEPLAPIVSTAAVAAAPGPVVATFHAWSERDAAYRLLAPVGRRLTGRLAASIAVSPAAARYASGALGVPLGRFRVIPNGVDVAQFATAAPIADLTDHERPLLLYVGRLEPRKGLDVLVRAWLRLRARRPLRLCIVGEGSERERCQQMVPPTLRPDVLFVGAVAESDKARYHASADVFVAPNTGGESFGIVLLEAMAAGLPVVASDIPGFRSVMTDAREGRFTPPGDAAALAQTLDALLGNDRLRAAMGAEGRRTVTDFDWSAVTRSVLEVYHTAVQGRGPGPPGRGRRKPGAGPRRRG